MRYLAPRPGHAAAALAIVFTAAGLAAGDEIVEVLDRPATYITYPTRWVVSDPVYTSTSYVLPTTSRTVLRPTYGRAVVTYAPTRYVVEETTRPRGLLGGLFRPWDTITRTRTYGEYTAVPTTYTRYVSTSVSLPVVTTSSVLSDPCDVYEVVAPSSRANGGQTNPTVNRKAGESNGSPPPKSVTSEPRSPQSPPEPSSGERAGASGASGRADGARAAEPPLEFESSPAAEKEGASRPASDGSGVSPAPAPAADDITIPGLNDPQSRTSLRPAATELSPRTALPAPSTLRGEVISANDQKPESNVRVVFRNRLQTYEDRVRLTDGLGRFEVLLPNGDWEIALVEPDGKSNSYGIITSAGGQFFDERDRAVVALRLNH
jgi:hypothetical protein